MRFVRILAAALAALLGGAGLASAADEAPSFAKDVKPFLKKYCMDCHSGARAKGGYSVATFDSLLKKGRGGVLVVAEKPDESRLILSMTGKTRKAMPPRGKPKPTADEIDKVREWIKAGAKDDTPADDKKKSGDAKP
jgi:Planctomycete cytochrome C